MVDWVIYVRACLGSESAARLGLGAASRVPPPFLPYLAHVWPALYASETIRRQRLANLVEHSLLERGAVQALEALHGRGIPTLLLKGVVISRLYYDFPELRPMGDIDVLVPPERYFEASHVLAELGWTTRGAADAALNHGCGYQRGRERLDLHQYMLTDCLWPGADQPGWDRSQPFELGPVSTRRLSEADQLFHLLVHGQEWLGHPGVWRMDAMNLLTRAGHRLDWDALLEEARRRDLLPALREAVTRLQREFEFPFPDAFLTRLQAIPVPLQDRLYWWSRKRRDALSFLPFNWLHWRRARAHTPTPLSLTDFLRARWGLPPHRSFWWELLVRIGCNLRSRFQGSGRLLQQTDSRPSA